MSREPNILSGAGSQDRQATGSAADATASTSLRSIIRVLAAQAARDDFRRAVGAADSTVTETSPITGPGVPGNG